MKLKQLVESKANDKPSLSDLAIIKGRSVTALLKGDIDEFAIF